MCVSVETCTNALLGMFDLKHRILLFTMAIGTLLGPEEGRKQEDFSTFAAFK